MFSLFSHITDPNLGGKAVETMFRFGRIQENGDWLLPAIVFVLLAVYFVRRYRIDGAELKLRHRSLLLVLRLAVLLVLLLYFLQPQWEHLVGSSRVAVLIDTSASMGNRDLVSPESGRHLLSDGEDAAKSEPSGESAAAEDAREPLAGPSRLEAVLDWIRRSELIDRLLENHDVAVYSFDRSATRIFQHLRPESGTDSTAATSTMSSFSDKDERSAESDRDDSEQDSGRNSGRTMNALKAEGEETCLGDALAEVLRQEQGRPLTGIVLLTDGRHNAGNPLTDPLETAETLRIPVFPIGVGPVRRPLNFRVGNIDVPDRAFPDDPFVVKVSVEMLGDGGLEARDDPWTFPVELWARPDGDGMPETKIGEQDVSFQKPGIVETFFEVRLGEAGTYHLKAEMTPPREDRFEKDNLRRTQVEIMDRKDRILLFASAPMRDYQFLSSQIHRDKSMSVDVYLPWSKPGTSQNAETILPAFPSDRAEMGRYDVVVAFDPNWRDLSPEQIDLLEHWVGRMGGGLILVAGPVNLGDAVTGWLSDMSLDKIRALYPVEFLLRQSAFDHRYHGDVQPWPLQFTRAGDEADFLRISDNPVESRTFWNEFPGFYGFFAVQSVKPAATPYVSSGSPEAMGRAESGALIVGQFYGAGRVLYLGSGELWRLRRSDERAFEQLTTRMLRHVAQGRLQRESDQGSLATDRRRYPLGGIAQLRITANDVQLRPLTQPTLPVDVLSPTGTLRTIDATLDPNVSGTYQAHLPLTEEGNWAVQLNLPECDRKIERILSVQMSDLERENPSRNEPLLREIAAQTGGAYFSRPTDALPLLKDSELFGELDFFADESDPESVSPQTDDPVKPITELLPIRSQRAVLDRAAEETTLRILLIAFCSLLMLEWTLRRLMKLA